MPALALLVALVAVVTTAAVEADLEAESTLQEWFTDNFLDGETQLVAGASADRAALGDEFLVCGGLPALQTRSSVLPANGGCPDVFTAVNGSCTCLTGLSSDADAWTFLVRPQTATGTGTGDPLPVTQPATDVLEIDAIRSLWVPSTLLSLRFKGVGSSPVKLTIVPDDRSGVGNLSPIVQPTDATVNVTVIEFFNIDLYQTTISAGSMIPTSATDITLRDCNISSFGFDFATGLGNIKTIDLSMNQLVRPYAGLNVTGLTCSYTLCVLEEFNISFNRLTEFPSIALDIKTLRKLYMQGNPLSDWNVSNAVFERIESLDELVADAPDESAYGCPQGGWKTAHDVRFCVASDGSTASGGSASADTTTAMLEYSAITGALLVVALLGVLVWQRRRYNAEQLERENRQRPSTMGTMTRGENAAAQALLLREPQLLARRVDYRDLKLTKCLSRGGFGLVFSGELHGRRVAVKKMRADMGVAFHQLELFVREISLMARLQHERVVEFVGVAWEATSLMDMAAITELMEGGDLRDVLYHHHARRLHHSHTGSTSPSEERDATDERVVDEGEALTWSGAKLKIALHVAQALAYLHSRSPPVVHRDLKSKNVLLSSALDAKLGDFGISRERPEEADEAMTAGMGTNFWIAPEVLLGEAYDERADIFSFGVVLSEIDTDDFPYWNAKNPPQGGRFEEGEILQLVAMGRKRPAFSAECPPAILALASRCLSVYPHERPSAVELTYHLGRIQPALLERKAAEMEGNNYSPDADAVDEFEDAEWMLSGVYSDMSSRSDRSGEGGDKRLGPRRYRRLDDDSARAVRTRQEGSIGS